jgi:predicted ATPase/DNA-binding CsgD family transcriptional regulator
LDAHRHNLPLQTTPLIGRAGELAAIAAALASDRLVTLTGSAGIGKTRLAVHTAAEHADAYVDGVAFVELATVHDASAVASTVASVLRVWETAAESTIDGITRFVADRSILLVLDNCEHVIDAVADLTGRLLASCQRLTILATSREPLGVPGEVAWRVPSLPAPAAGGQVDVVELSTFDAVRLFADRARRARPGFALTDLNAGAVSEICRRLDGIPLALELAAARCRAMAPNKVAEELDRRFLLLTGGARTVLARQQTLLASVEWSYELLTPDERVVFRGLGAFTGPFPLDAAEAVCGDPGDAGWAVFDVLSRLVDKSLVVHDPVTDWYRLLETIRLYAVDRLRDAAELQAIRDRHAAWWTTWLDAHHPDGPSDSDLDAVDHAYPNLRAALQWAATTDADVALELAGGLGIYWYLRGLYGDAITLGDLALTSSTDRGPAWVRAVGRMAMPRYYADDERYAANAIAEACTIAAATGDELTPLRCRATGILSTEDIAEFRDLAGTAEACGDLWVAGRMHSGVALWGVLLGEPDALIALERTAAIAEQLDASSLRFATHQIEAAQLAAELRVREAITRLEDAMGHADRASPGMITAFSNLAGYCQICGEPEPFERVTSFLARSPRDWGAMAGIASAVQRLPERLGRDDAWDGPDVALAWVSASTLWVFADLFGDDKVTLFPSPRGGSGNMAQFAALVLSGRSAFREGRFRDAENAAAVLVRRRAEDRHFWLLVLARCATAVAGHLEAARLFGAVAGTQERFGLPWLPQLLVSAKADGEGMCRDALGDAEFDAAFAAGFELDLDAAVAYAVRARGERKRPATGWDSLTPTELAVVDQVAVGRSNPEIAEALLMGRSTVKTHLGHIFTKLGLANRAELAALAARLDQLRAKPG